MKSNDWRFQRENWNLHVRNWKELECRIFMKHFLIQKVFIWLIGISHHFCGFMLQFCDLRREKFYSWIWSKIRIPQSKISNITLGFYHNSQILAPLVHVNYHSKFNKIQIQWTLFMPQPSNKSQSRAHNSCLII